MIDSYYLIFALVVAYLIIKFFDYPFALRRFLIRINSKSENKSVAGIALILWQYFQIALMCVCFGICEYIIIIKFFAEK